MNAITRLPNLALAAARSFVTASASQVSTTLRPASRGPRYCPSHGGDCRLRFLHPG